MAYESHNIPFASTLEYYQTPYRDLVGAFLSTWIFFWKAKKIENFDQKKTRKSHFFRCGKIGFHIERKSLFWPKLMSHSFQTSSKRLWRKKLVPQNFCSKTTSMKILKIWWFWIKNMVRRTQKRGIRGRMRKWGGFTKRVGIACRNMHESSEHEHEDLEVCYTPYSMSPKQLQKSVDLFLKKLKKAHFFLSKSKISKLWGSTNLLISHSVVPKSTTKCLIGTPFGLFFQHEFFFEKSKKSIFFIFFCLFWSCFGDKVKGA